MIRQYSVHIAFVILYTKINFMQTSTMSKVSVIIPAYNEEKYILQTLSALLKQDYPCFEIIIADNASTDSTSLLIKQFIDKQPLSGISIQLKYENRQGTNFARECARQAATGSIIAQIDADCIPSSNWISKGVLSLGTNQKRIAVTGPYD